MVDIRYPAINGATEKEQLSEIRSYLYQLADALQDALAQTERNVARVMQAGASMAVSEEKRDPLAQFQAMKALIIKSADIVEAYYEGIDALLSTSGKYVASGEFGSYGEFVNQRLSAETDRIDQNITRIEAVSAGVVNVNDRIGNMEKTTHTSLSELSDRLGGVSDTLAGSMNFIKTQQAYIRYGAVGTSLDETGLAARNAAGIEIGDYQTLSDGSTQLTNRRFARFTAYGLELFSGDKDAAPVAYIKQNKLFITNAEVTNSFRLGGFILSKSKGLSFDWVGGSL